MSFPLPPKPVIGILIVFMIFLQWRVGYFKNFKSHLKSLSRKEYALKVLLLISITLCLLFVDNPLTQMVREIDARYHDLTQAGDLFNRNKHFWLLVAMLYFSGLILSRKLSLIAFGILLTSAMTGIFVQILKFIFLRARPYSYMGPFSFFNFSEIRHHAFQSLPSGDVALISGAAAYLFYHFRNTPLRVLFFLAPLISAFARISTEKHWPSDTFVYVGIALIMAGLICDYERKRPVEPVKPLK